MKETGRPAGRMTGRMLATLAKCPRRYQIEYVNNYRLKGRRPAPWPPSVKALLRDALRERDVAEARGVSPLRVRAASEAILGVYQEEMRRLIGSVSPDEAARLEEEIAAAADEARRVVAHYDYTQSHDINFRPLEFMRDPSGVPIVDRIVEHKLLSSELYTYAERVDGIVTDGNTPAALIRRFTSNPDPNEVKEELGLDLTVIGELWAASHILGDPVTLAVVDVVRTKAPSIPETIQCRKCRGDGKVKLKGEDGTVGEELVACDACRGSGIGGMSKRACDTTVEIWKASAKKFGLDPEAESNRCLDVIAKLQRRAESFAYRILVQVQTADLKAWALDAQTIAGFASYHAANGYWPRNPGACVGRSGPCPYRRACNNQDSQDVACFAPSFEPFPGLE